MENFHVQTWQDHYGLKCNTCAISGIWHMKLSGTGNMMQVRDRLQKHITKISYLVFSELREERSNFGIWPISSCFFFCLLAKNKMLFILLLAIWPLLFNLSFIIVGRLIWLHRLPRVLSMEKWWGNFQAWHQHVKLSEHLHNTVHF